MKLTRALIFATLAFAAGALVATRNQPDTLRTALRPDAPNFAPDRSRAKKLAGAAERTSEDRIGHVLSALQEHARLKRQHALYEAIGELSAAEVATMMDRAGRLPFVSNYYVTMALLERWFDLDPERAKVWVRARPGDQRYWCVWAAKLPENALSEMHLQHYPHSMATTLATAIETVAGSDKQAQAARLAAMPADATRDIVLTRTMAAWAKTDAAGAFAFSRTLPAGPLRQSTGEAALREWAKTDAPHAAQALVAMLPELKPGLNGSSIVADIAGALTAGSDNPRAALTWLSQLPAEQRGSAPYVAAASAWAKKDPSAALAWCRENGLDAGGRGGAVIGAAMNGDPLKTLQWVQTLPAGDERDRLLERAVSATSKLTFPPVAADRAAMVLGLLQQLPPEAQARAAFSLGWSSGHNGRIEDVRVWTERLGDGALRSAAVEAAVAYRYDANPGNREKLLAQFPDGPERDGALTGIARREGDETPARAAQTAGEIADPAARRKVLDGIVGNWLERNPAQARAWLLDAKTLPSEWTQAWLAELNPPR